MNIAEIIRQELSGPAADRKREALRMSLRHQVKQDLWLFARWCCGYADIDTSLHRGMCDRWQKRMNARFSLWLIPRSHLKTSLWTIAGTLWELVRNADLRVLIVNAKWDIAAAILAEIQSIVQTNEIFRFLFPEYCWDLAPKYKSARCVIRQERLDFPCSVNAGRKIGSIEIMSVGAKLVSQHYDLLIYDDPVNDENTTTRDFRDKIDTWYKNSLQLRVDLNSRVRVIGTRWHFDDLYARIIRKEEIRRKEHQDAGKRIKPQYLIYRRQVIENGSPIWPERFKTEDLDDLRREIGTYIYSCQYLNDPLPEEDAYFKRKNIQLIEEFEVPSEIVNFMAVDLADEETTKGDFTVLTIASFDIDGNMYVREIIRDKLSILDVVEKIWFLCRKWNPQRVGIETTAFQKAVVKFYKRRATAEGWQIPWQELERSRASKFKRTLSFQPRVERGDFYYVADIPNCEWMIEEMTTFPLGAHDDILDTLVDIENMSYSAPKILEETKTPGTYDAVYGPLFEDVEEIELESSFIGRETL